MGKPKTKQKSREERLARKRENEKKRYEKIKSNSELYAELKRKNKEQYQRRKQEGKIKSIHDLPPRKQRALKKKWKEESKKAYQRRKEKKAAIQRYIDCNSPPESDMEEIAPQNEPEMPACVPGCSSSNMLQKSIACSPMSSPPSSPGSSVSVSSDARKLLRKLRYEKDKEIESLRYQLQAVKKVSDMYRKQLSRQQENILKASSSQQTACSSTNREITPPLNIQSEFNSSLANPLCEGIVQSYKSIKSNKMKHTITNILEPYTKSPAIDKTSQKLLRAIFRRRKKSVKYVASNKKKNDVHDFLTDDVNSSCAADKKEFVKKQGKKVQVRYLNDHLKNLHTKFISAYKYRLSYATFCIYKPFWILPASRRSRNTCLCVIHENFTLLMCALSKLRLIPHKDLTSLLKSICCESNNPQCLSRNCRNCRYKKVQYLDYDNTKEFHYWTWNTKTEDIVTNRTKKKIRVVKKEKITTQPIEAIKTFESMIDKFLKHCGRMVTQQKAIKQIKNELKTNEALVHIDFSENYKCGYSSEIQSAHFGGSKPQISIHASVLYFFDTDGQKRTLSFSTLSSNLRHDAAAVWAHIEPILVYLHTNSPQITNLHILSDSATSQYRNYKVFFLISTFKWSFPQLKCVTWNYSESGHGKGAPDGVGAVLKRTADTFINQGIDIPNFETFSDLLKDKLTNIVIKIVTDEDISQKELLFPAKLPSFKGTLQVHQAVWSNLKSSIALRKLSCTEDLCKTNATFCHHGNHLGFHVVRELENHTSRQSHSETDDYNDNVSNHSEHTELMTVANLERCSIFSASCEMELPSELRRTILDNILTEDPENKTESPLSSRTRNIFDSNSDSSDYNIF